MRNSRLSFTASAACALTIAGTAINPAAAPALDLSRERRVSADFDQVDFEKTIGPFLSDTSLIRARRIDRESAF
jgi:hypothetical protein